MKTIYPHAAQKSSRNEEFFVFFFLFLRVGARALILDGVSKAGVGTVASGLQVWLCYLNNSIMS